MISMLKTLPATPSGKTGWPWTEESDLLPETLPNGKPWPKISIVTPSFNQGQFIEETIRSVLLQNYPNLEYIIIDGGSTDNSVAIIKKYEPWLAYWISEKDKGQAHAINKGFARATGDILAWLNSDDMYFPKILAYVAESFGKGDPNRFWLVTGVEYYDHESGKSSIKYQVPCYSLLDWIFKKASLNQQGAFWSKAIQTKAGPLLDDVHFGFDKELWMRFISLGYTFECSTDVVGAFYRMHDRCKLKKNYPGFQYDWSKIYLQYLPRDFPDHQKVLKKIYRNMAGFKVLLSQDKNKKILSRLSDLLAAIRYSPRIIFDRAFIGSILRIIIPGYAFLRNKNCNK
jgi:glycosyltransferase involved in cell wall biosynthesis